MSTLPPQLAPLLDPSTFPHKTDNLRVIETHISWILLTGPFAYKIKKPVDLGFVDYSTLPLRHRYCHDEVRLNRRLAPELYLEVVRFAFGDGKLTIESDSAKSTTPAIEYAVKMRQFDQSQLLSQQLSQHAMPLEWFEQLGQNLASFHDHCAVADPKLDFGDPEVFANEVAETLGVLQNAAVLTSSQQHALSELRRWFDEEFRRLQEFFRMRKDTGHIRACHGDLHCGNMLVEDRRIVVFDGIEFNDHFRWIDTLNDLAFAWMDLVDRGAKREASRLLNRYLEASGDYQGMAAWRLFVANRALVRAKVSVLRMEQLAAGKDEESVESKSAAIALEISRYLNLASQIVASPRTWMVLTSGISGSGKSLLAQHLSDATGAVRVRSDVERKRIGFTNRESPGFLSDENRHRELSGDWYASPITREVYERLASLAGALLDAGLPVIVDATFLRREMREIVWAVALQLRTPYLIAMVDVDVETALQRLQQRQAQGDQTSDATHQILEQQLNQDPNWAAVELEHLIRVVNDRNAKMDQLVQQILARSELHG